MVGGEIRIEDIIKVDATRYEWNLGDGHVSEELIFSLGDGQMFVVTGVDGFFKMLHEAIEHHDLYINELGKDWGEQ